MRRGSEFIANEALAGGAIYVDTGCTLRVNNTVHFYNNTAPRTAAAQSGGGAIFVNGGSVVLGSDVLFEGNADGDISTEGGSVTCANPLSPLNCDPCSGAFDIPVECAVCSSPGPSTCPTCPQGSYGGAEANFGCALCPYGYTTIYPPSATSSAECVPITEPPTVAPTGQPTTTPTRVRGAFACM